jgi:hypothetical protein
MLKTSCFYEDKVTKEIIKSKLQLPTNGGVETKNNHQIKHAELWLFLL